MPETEGRGVSIVTMSDKCMRCNAEAVPIRNDPEYGDIYQCLHNPDHQFMIITDDVHLIWTVERPSAAGRYPILRCMTRPSRGWSADRSGRPKERWVCEANGAALDAGKPWMSRPNGTILMGKDYLVAKRRLG